MASKDNTVNIPAGLKVKKKIKRIEAAKKPYHHGDLRGALLEAGQRLLQTRKADDLALREVARDVGVSATAVYRHFPDKGALLSALAQDGLDRLGQAQRQATAVAGGGHNGFLASGLAYVQFAVANPALFRLIFSCAQSEDLLDRPLDSVTGAMHDLRADIDRLMPPHLPAPARKAAALHAWALVHGLALLVLDAQIPLDWVVIQSVLSTTGLPQAVD